ncbi:hypothetical protein [uncultured Campylobacter sp.]|uniref:hypothetical protein n=1 Tax=uncultured Campylobacter sp. TaxID=218934 RepID=UPI00261C7458|nr:hypothetical protein [uncultured Campylobacter sp.]
MQIELYAVAIAKRGICLLVVCKFRALNLAAASQARKIKRAYANKFCRSGISAHKSLEILKFKT